MRQKSSAQLLQTLSGKQERFVFLAKAKAHLLRAQRRIAVETRARHTRDADFANQVTREFHVVFETESTDVGHDVVSAVRRESPKACLLKFRQNQIAPRFVIGL